MSQIVNCLLHEDYLSKGAFTLAGYRPVGFAQLSQKLSASIRDVFTQLGNVPGYSASVIRSLHRVTDEEANHMLATCALVLVVSFSRDRNHGLSWIEFVSCCFDFSSSQ